MYDADNIIIGVKVGDDVKEAYVLVTEIIRESPLL